MYEFHCSDFFRGFKLVWWQDSPAIPPIYSMETNIFISRAMIVFLKGNLICGAILNTFWMR